MQKLSSFGRGQKFVLKSHLRASCMKPFNCCVCFIKRFHFQKEWKIGARMYARSVMGLFGIGGAVARAKTFSLMQVKFQINNEQKLKYCMTQRWMEILKKKVKKVPKVVTQKQKLFCTFFYL